MLSDNINGVPKGSTIPQFYVNLIRNYNYFLNNRLFNENSSFYMDISRQHRYERSLKDYKRSLHGKIIISTLEMLLSLLISYLF